MVKHCCAYGCKNVWKPNQNIKYHRFPLKRPEVCAKWIQVLRLNNFKPTIHTTLCSEHFTENSYMESSLNKNLLKKDAVPSIFNFPVHLQKKVVSRRVIIRHIPEAQQPLTTIETEDPLVSTSHDVSVQTSPKRFAKTPFEKQLRAQIKLLQQKLKRRDATINNMKQFVQHLNENGKSSRNLVIDSNDSI